MPNFSRFRKVGNLSQKVNCSYLPPHLSVKRTLIRSANIRTPIRSSLRNVILAPYTTSTSTSTKLQALAEALKSSKDVSSIHRSCSALAAWIKDTPDIPSQSGPNNNDGRLLSILQSLAVSARAEDMWGIGQILRDFYPILGMKPTSGIYTSILLSLANGGHNDQVLNLLLKMPQLPGHFTPTLEQLHAVLAACSQHSSFKFLQDIVVSIRKMGQPPTNETFATLLLLRWRKAKHEDDIPTINELSWAIFEAARQGLAFDPKTADILYQSYADIGRFSEAKKILSLYKSVLTTLRNSSDYTDILRLEKTYGIKCTTIPWSIVLSNCLRSENFMQAFEVYDQSKNLMQAFEVYDQSKKAGITPDAALIAPLLGALARLNVENPSDESINRSLAIYRDLADKIPPLRHSLSSKPYLYLYSNDPEMDIYNALFRMLLASKSETDYLSVADTLLKEMKDRNLPTNSSAVTAFKIISEMRRAMTYTAALDSYRKHQSDLNNNDYALLLQVYCRLSFRGDLEAARYAARKIKATRSRVKANQQAPHGHDSALVDKKFFTPF